MSKFRFEITVDIELEDSHEAWDLAESIEMKLQDAYDAENIKTYVNELK